MEHDVNHALLACRRAMAVVSNALAVGELAVVVFGCNALAGIEQPVDLGSDAGDASSAADRGVEDVTNARDEGTSLDGRATPDVPTIDGGSWCTTQSMFDFCTDFDVVVDVPSDWDKVYALGGGIVERSSTT
jgi:hypothetical protein